MEQPNLNYINDLAGDDDAFREKLVSTIKDELPAEITVYLQALNIKDYKAAAGHVHKLKHKISILGLEKSYYLAEQYEDHLKNNTTEEAEEFAVLLKNMQDFVATL